MTVVLFAGPSLYGVDKMLLRGFELRPPAIAGDMLRAMMDGATAVGLVDGLFANVPSVWHKEILAALVSGIGVLGAASMGALRAAECRAFGMRGVGRIFEDYINGRRTADADVAVLHGPVELDYKPLTLALVDAEAALAGLALSSRIDHRESKSLIESARSLGFRERTWDAVLSQARLPEERRVTISQAITSGSFSQKTQDALELVSVLRAYAANIRGESQLISGPFNRTDYFVRLQERVNRDSLRSQTEASEPK